MKNLKSDNSLLSPWEIVKLEVTSSDFDCNVDCGDIMYGMIFRFPKNLEPKCYGDPVGHPFY